MGAPIKEKNSSESFVSYFGNQKCLSRSISENGRPKQYLISKSTQTNIPERTLAEISFSVPTSDISTAVTNVHVTAVEPKDGVADCYEKLCCNLTDVKEQIQDVISHLGASQADMKRMTGLVNVKEHIVDLKDKIKTLESHIERTVVTECELIFDNDNDFTSLHGYLTKPGRKQKIALTKHTHKIIETMDVLGDLLRLRVFPTYKQQSVPFTLESYFDNISRRETTDTSQSMSNEMLRLSSLSSFPRGINISMFRLARAGFYYTGRSSETKCYSCGTTYEDWTSNDDPMVVHTNISPTCDIVRREAERSSVEGENRSINRSAEQISPNNGVSGQPVHQGDTTSMYPSQLQSNTVSPHYQMTSTLNNVSTSCQSETTSENTDVTTSSTSEQRGRKTHLSLQNCQTPRNEPGTSASGQCNHTDDCSNLGINVEKPKYSNYAPLQVRISSFRGWPSYLDQTPCDMAMAGFLFAGYHDYTRCFFCGGGLRNWEAGDDPWIEHARWFPKCAFLRQNKGDKFINAVLKRHQELEQANTSNEHTISPQINESVASNISPTTSRPSQQLQSVAVRSVLEMGYTNEQVLDALRKIQGSSSNSSQLSATDIMKVLLNDDDSSTLGAASQVVTNGTNAEEINADDLPELSNDDTESLIEENRQLRDQRSCKVCLDLDATIAFLPCGHMHSLLPRLRTCYAEMSTVSHIHQRNSEDIFSLTGT